MQNPEKLRNQHVTVQVDNLGCYFAWENGYCKEDQLASILTRALVLVSAWLSSVVHVVHLPRESTWESRVADRLSREKTTGRREKDLVGRFEKKKLPVTFTEWMKRPTEDWSMPTRLVNEMSSLYFATIN